MILTHDILDLRDNYLLPYSGDTLNTYDYYLGRYLAWCVDQQLDPLQASRPDIERYVQQLQETGGLCASSVCTATVPGRGFYRFAHDEGVIDRDPAVRARRPHHHYLAKDTLGLDRAQMRAFLSAGIALGGRYYASAFLLACMALRASEICSLDISDYSRTLRGHRVLEFVGKGRVPARMPLPVPVVRALDAAAGERFDGPLIQRLDGGRPQDHTIRHRPRRGRSVCPAQEAQVKLPRHRARGCPGSQATPRPITPTTRLRPAGDVTVTW